MSSCCEGSLVLASLLNKCFRVRALRLNPVNKRLKQIFVGLCVCCAAFPVNVANACSRAVYFGQMGQTVTGRTMDWQEDMHTDLWIFPRGMRRDGGMGRERL